jgi:2-keto-4-pentenoate hydratase/2-oxohepta-3-ene-1,7-dioic acid hydratase in catechol pathway
MTLKAGTLIATGTPAGVAFSYDPPKYLREGDRIECRIERIGTLINRVGA